MSHAFTIVPAVAADDILEEMASVVEAQPNLVAVPGAGGATCFYCAGHPDVVDDAVEKDYFGLACVRIAPGGSVVHVDAEGYEGSVVLLEALVRWILQEFGPCRVFDDESGEELDLLDARDLLAPEEEFVEP